MLKIYLTGLFLIGLLAISCLTAILVYVDPASANWIVSMLFYTSLLIGSTTILALIGWIVRRISRKRVSVSLSFRYLEISARQGFLISAVLVTVLILKSYNILEWWYVVGLLILIGLAEWYLSDK